MTASLGESEFSALILAWFDKNKRELPWRQSNNAYQIWLSEIILQQTRVSQGLPYYYKFINAFSSVEDLAKAKNDDVLRLWQGLGYYSRARNLHKCAKKIAEDYDGIFPDSVDELKKLPGIGNYTAAAIASQAYNRVVPVVDGNVYRLLSRYYGVETDIGSSAAYKEFAGLAAELIDHSRPGDFNQAMMEFGALQCSPRQPSCEHCVLKVGCLAFNNSLQEKLPVKKKRVKVRPRFFHYLLFQSGNRMLLRQRQENDIWKGLFEFPLIETDKNVSFGEIEHPLLEQLKEVKVMYEVEDKIIRHILSHQVLNVNFVVINLDETIRKWLKTGEYKWYAFEEAENLPKPVLIANYLDSYLNSIHLQEENRRNGRS